MSITTGPNKKKLLTLFVARVAIPNDGNVGDGMTFLLDKQHRAEVMKQAHGLANQAIDAMRAAPDRWYSDDEEEIAGILLDKLRERGVE